MSVLTCLLLPTREKGLSNGIDEQEAGKMNLRELAFQLSAITLIADAAKEAKDRLRREFAQALEEVGADAAKAVLEGEIGRAHV